MKTLVLFLGLVVIAFAQRGGSQPSHSQPAPQVSQQHSTQISQPRYQYPQVRGNPGFGRPWRYPIIIHPGYFPGYYGGYNWNYYYGMGFWPYYYYPNWGTSYVYRPCKKETLKNSDGKKHQVLVCVQPDGTMKVIADGDLVVPVPPNVVK
jgi:hypothetical protein